MRYHRLSLRWARLRPRKLVLFSLIMLSAISAVVFALRFLPKLPTPTIVTAPGLSAAAAVASAAAALAAVVGTQTRELRRTRKQQLQGIKQNLNTVLDNVILSDPKRGCPIVKTVTNPTLVGVSRSLIFDDGSPADGEYLRRDAHENVIVAMQAANFVLIVGESKSGKSRMAFECIKETFPSRLFVSPIDGAAVRKMVTEGVSFANTVVWLDDLDRFLTTDGLDQLTVNRLLSTPRCSIMATIKSTSHASLAPDSNKNTAEWRIVQLARPVRLTRLLSANERRRLQPRLAKALKRHRSLGLAEYLSGATDLLDRYRDAEEAYQAGWALTRAAIELVRCGLEQPQAEVIQASATGFLQTTLGAKEYDAAWKWALEPIYGASALLVKHRDGIRPFDYLLDETGTGVSPHVWELACQTDKPVDLASIGTKAIIQNRLNVARITQHKLISLVDGYQKAKAHYRLAVVEMFEGNRAEAIKNARISDKLGYDLAPFLLGDIVLARKRRREAEVYFRRALERGFAPAAFKLAQLAIRRGDVDTEWEYLKKGVELADSACRLRMAELYREKGEHEQAENLLTAMARKGDARAAAMLGDVMLAAQRYPEALTWYETAAAAGESNAAISAGFVNEMIDRPRAAERWYRDAIDWNVSQASLYLGCLYAKLGRDEEAAQLLDPIAARSGLAADRLSMVYLRQNRLDEARNVLEKAAHANFAGARHRLARFYESQGELDAAASWYQREANNGDKHCMAHLGIIALRLGRLESAQKWSIRATADENRDITASILTSAVRLSQSNVFMKMFRADIVTDVSRRFILRNLRHLSKSGPSRLETWVVDFCDNASASSDGIKLPKRIRRRVR